MRLMILTQKKFDAVTFFAFCQTILNSNNSFHMTEAYSSDVWYPEKGHITGIALFHAGQ